MPNWVWVVIIIVLVLWLLGLFTNVLGPLINILLVVALVLAIVWLWRRVRTR